MRTVEKPWGKEVIWAETPFYVGKRIIINPGHCLSRQYHEQKHESFLVLEGILCLEIGQGAEMKTMIMAPGEMFDCPPGTVHRMINEFDLNPGVAEVLEISTPHLEDVIRLEDNYKRV